MAAYQTRSDQFGLVSGLRQPTSDRIVSVEPGTLFAPEARKGQLYLLVEAELDQVGSAEACHLVSRSLRKTFYDYHSFSLSSSLREAVRVANRALYQHNFSVAPQRRIAVGVCCAALRGNDLYIAQVAPGQAFVLSEGRLRALPTPPAWHSAHVSAAPFLKRGAVGSSLSVEPELYRCIMGPGDALLLCSSNLGKLLAREQVEQLLHFHDPGAAIDQLQALCQQHGLKDAHALILELAPPLSAAARSKPLSPNGLGERIALLFRGAGDGIGRATGELVRIVRRRTPEQPRGERQPTLPDGLLVDPAPRPRPIDVGQTLEELHVSQRAAQQPTAALQLAAPPTIPPPVSAHTSLEADELPPSALLGERSYQDQSSRRRIDLGDNVEEESAFKPHFERRPLSDMNLLELLALPFRQLNANFAESRRTRAMRRHARSRPRPQQPLAPVSRHKGLSYRRTSPPFPWLWLFLLVSLVSVFILYGLNLSQDRADDDTGRYIATAEQRMAAVRAAPDDPTALQRLESARAAIEEVRASPLVTVTNADAWLRYQELQREYDRALASLQRLSYLDDVEVVANHPLPNGSFASVVAPPAKNITDTSALGYLYALDSDRERSLLYRISVERCNVDPSAECGPPEAFLKPNDTIANTVVGPVRAHAWREDNIIAVDEGQGGFNYYFRNGGAWLFSRLAGSELWALQDRLDIELYDGNLYVWGAEPGQILKFTSGRYGDLPLPWIDSNNLNGRDLASSVDMAVDGSIYLLQPNGAVVVMEAGGFSREIVPEALNPPLGTVTSFFITGPPGEGFIFLVEPLNERIIQIDKQTGKVVQQIVAGPSGSLRLDQLRSLYVDDTGSRPVLYIVNGGQIVRAPLPAPPRPFRGPGSPTPPALTPSPPSSD